MRFSNFHSCQVWEWEPTDMESSLLRMSKESKLDRILGEVNRWGYPCIGLHPSLQPNMRGASWGMNVIIGCPKGICGSLSLSLKPQTLKISWKSNVILSLSWVQLCESMSKISICSFPRLRAAKLGQNGWNGWGQPRTTLQQCHFQKKVQDQRLAGRVRTGRRKTLFGREKTLFGHPIFFSGHPFFSQLDKGFVVLGISWVIHKCLLDSQLWHSFPNSPPSCLVARMGANLYMDTQRLISPKMR